MDKRWGVSRFSVENFCLSVLKNSCGGPFNDSENFEHRKILYIRRGCHYFQLFNFFCLSVPKKFMGNPSMFQKNSGIEKTFCLGRYHGFLSKNFSLTVPKNCVGDPFCVSKNFRYRKILCIRTGYHYSPLKFFCLTVPKNHNPETITSKRICLTRRPASTGIFFAQLQIF